jgi:hypothetical protein
MAERRHRREQRRGVVSGPVTFLGFPPGPGAVRHLLEELRALDDLRRDALGNVAQR